MGGGHHHDSLPKIPNYQDYRVEDVPQLMRVQKRLAQIGLRDNWLRNEVWRYTKGVNSTTYKQKFTKTFAYGFKYGLLLAMVTAGIEYTFFPIREAPHYDDHGHH